MSSALPLPAASKGKAKYTNTLWPELVGTGRPSPPFAWPGPVELFWGTFIDGTWVPGWTPDFRGAASRQPMRLPLHAPLGTASIHVLTRPQAQGAA